MRKLFIVLALLALTMTACDGDAEPEPTPSPITSENVGQLTMHQTIDEDETLYYTPNLRPDGGVVLLNVQSTSTYEATFTLYDTSTGETLWAVLGNDLWSVPGDAAASIVTFSPDGNHVLITFSPLNGNDSQIVILDAANGKEIQRFDVPYMNHDAAYAADGDLIIASMDDFDTADYRLLALDATNGEVVGELTVDSVILSLEARGNAVAYTTLDANVVVTFEHDADGVVFSEPIYNSEGGHFGYPAVSPDASLVTLYDPDPVSYTHLRAHET